MMRLLLTVTTGLLGACSAHSSSEQQGLTARASSRNSTGERPHISPAVDHHQHIFGAMLIDPPPPQPPEIILPPEFQDVLRQRQSLTAETPLHDLYTEDAQVLNIVGDVTHWVRDERSIRYILGSYAEGIRFVPNHFAASGLNGHIAGAVRLRGSSNDQMHFVLALSRRTGGRWRIAVESVTTIPPNPWGSPITAEYIIQVLNDAGIQRAVVASTAFWAASGIRQPARPNEREVLRQANDWVIQQTKLYPERLVAFCAVNPLREYAIEEMRRCAASRGVRGIKLHLGSSAVNLRDDQHRSALREFFRAANGERMALMVHQWSGRNWGLEHARALIEDVLPAAPDVVVQIAHAGGAGRYVYDDVMAYYADLFAARDPRVRNVYFDLATVVDEAVSQEALERLATHMRRIGLERFLFGSDMPISTRPAPVQAWATFRRRMPLAQDEVRIIAANVAPYLR